MDTPTIPPTLDSTAEIAATVGRLRATFDRGETRPLSWRRQQLEAMLRMLEEHESAILAALAEDLGKPEFEALGAEVFFVRNELQHTLAKLRKWAAPERVRTNLVVQPARSRIIREPLGVVLIIAPWNFPFQLALAPLVGALAAGNCAVVKPSELSPATSSLMTRLLSQYLSHDAIAVVEGGVPETTVLLQQRWDHIFFTGSTRVGRIVMAAAAKHLTPVTLELGGKCPVIIDRRANIDVAAKRICWGKFANAGQICLAPDYLLVDEAVYEPMVAALKATVQAFYGADPKASPDYGRIISTHHHRRLMGMLEGATIVVGGEADEAERYIAPTLVRDVDEDSPLMQEEIFGPLLPILRVRNVDEAISRVNARPKPLALYVYSEDSGVCEQVIARTSSGGASINHSWMHVAVPDLPFGGVGESGMGAYHGRASFETFSHRKSVLSKPTAIDPDVAYPPYTEFKTNLVKRLL